MGARVDGRGARGPGLGVNLMSSTESLRLARPQSGLLTAVRGVEEPGTGTRGTSRYCSQHGGEGMRDLSVFWSTQMLRARAVQNMKQAM